MAHAYNSLRKAHDLFIMDLQAGSYSPSTVRQYKWSLSHLLLHLATNGVEGVDQIMPAHLRQYITYIKGRVKSEYTVIAAGVAASSFLKFCVNEGIIRETPMRNVRLPSPPKREVKVLREADVPRLMAAAKGVRNKALLMFLLDTGVRSAECAALNIGDIDMEAGSVAIRHGKGNKQRTVYMGVKTKRALARYLGALDDLANDSPLWRSYAGRMAKDSILRVVRKTAESIGIKCDVHTLRRTFATTCLRNGINIYVLQRLMGHSDVDTLRHYLNVTSQDVQGEYRNASPIDNL